MQPHEHLLSSRGSAAAKFRSGGAAFLIPPPCMGAGLSRGRAACGGGMPVCRSTPIDRQESGGDDLHTGLARTCHEQPKVILDWAVEEECGITASPCIRSGREPRYPDLSCTGE